MKPSKTALVAFSLVFLALAAAWGFLVFWSYSFKGDIERAAEEERQKSSEGSYLASLRTLMREEKGDIDAIGSIFIHEEEIPAFVESLEKKASEAGVDAGLGSLSLGSGDEGSNIVPLSIGIAGRGSWGNLMRFIASLDSLSTASKIDGVLLSKIESSSPETKEVVWNARIDFTQYVEKAKQQSK